MGLPGPEHVKEQVSRVPVPGFAFSSSGESQPGISIISAKRVSCQFRRNFGS